MTKAKRRERQRKGWTDRKGEMEMPTEKKDTEAKMGTKRRRDEKEERKGQIK